jgi:xanthine dehydrogenase small subunit
MRNTIRFVRRGKVVTLDHVNPMQTVLDYLRLEEKSRGTKEGCNEGDCGACTVALGTLDEGTISYQPVNACILLTAQLDGRELVTVEDLSQDGQLHPVQQAMVSEHASQCGFCTPGFVMSIWTLHTQNRKSSRQDIVEQLAGNLCRCTGYRPIIVAAEKTCEPNAFKHDMKTVELLQEINDNDDVLIGTETSFTALPSSPEMLAALAEEHPDATIVGGATDVGLWITKQLRTLPKVIHTSRVKPLHEIIDGGLSLSIGAAATYAEAESALKHLHPDIGTALKRIGSQQVRASGTIGGNIANGSPIGDMPPILIALSATLHLRKGIAQRELPLEDFFIAYGKQDREPGELVWRIDVPKLATNDHFRCYKISKRFDQDISAVMSAFMLKLTGTRVVSARFTFGGMAATPMRARKAEAAIFGAEMDDPATWDAAIAALAEDFTPITDMRATAEYRIIVAQNLLHKALIEIAGEPAHRTRVTTLEAAQ